ncbi:MAG: long-chain fatty acid--CoA ligase [Candidatus Abyssobacteria bacterium SURF_5]|uniref:Long-chain fatty acid--CoA ligase n=1 Tax=Abyssobacteria bacterium (strain SURF_5) TaxID=2093360 RepID=A0A3A4NV51_ABYX5|nr:MAG: long-chain fatty acid--CoA ligase [Candidatus Abyssubacteria bacterium SURF_5]
MQKLPTSITTVGQMLEYWAMEAPTKPALYFRDEVVTFSELNRLSNRYANVLSQLGVGPGDRVCIFCPNRLEFLYSYFGLIKIGAMMVSLSVMLKADEAKYIIDDARAKMIITTEYLYPVIEPIKDQLETIEHILYLDDNPPAGVTVLPPLVERAADEFHTREFDPDSVACIIYTSGTTGRPKGAMLTHNNLLHNYESANILLKTTSEDVLLVPGLPLFHLLAQICVMAALYGGVPSVLMEFFVPQMVLENIARYKANSFSGVPTMFALLLNDPEIDNYDLSSLRICFCSSAPLSLSLLRRFEERTGAIITEGYGLTEATALVTSNPIDGQRKPGSVGVPIRCEVRVVDEKDRDMPVGEVGEIIIRGKNVMKGYYNNQKATAETMRNGWLHTGDMGNFDSDGYLYVVDRKKDLIITGGYNIYPAEIENVLYKHPAVAMATVIGVPDEIKGEIAKAYVVLKEGQTVTEKEIIDFCRERIAKYKAPRAVEFRETLPTTPTGKILKRELRNQVLGRRKKETS